MSYDTDWRIVGDIGEPDFEDWFYNSDDSGDYDLKFKRDSQGIVRLYGKGRSRDGVTDYSEQLGSNNVNVFIPECIGTPIEPQSKVVLTFSITGNSNTPFLYLAHETLQNGINIGAGTTYYIDDMDMAIVSTTSSIVITLTPREIHMFAVADQFVNIRVHNLTVDSTVTSSINTYCYDDRNTMTGSPSPDGEATVTQKAWPVMFTLPTGYRPSSNVDAVSYYGDTENDIVINTDGEIIPFGGNEQGLNLSFYVGPPSNFSDWIAGTYSENAIRTYEGKIYVSQTDDNTSTPGTNSDWEETLTKGDKGDTGATGPGFGYWDSDYATETGYGQNAIVAHAGNGYISQMLNNDKTPGTDNLYWKKVFGESVVYDVLAAMVL